MIRRSSIVALLLCAFLVAPGAAPAAQSQGQRLFRSKLLSHPRVSDYVKSRLRNGGFVDRHIRYADLTGEGKTDAVVLVHSGTSAGRIGLYIFSAGRGDILYLQYRNQRLYRASARTRPASDERPRGAVIYRQPIWDQGDRLCCPGAFRDTELRWSRRARRFKVVDRRVIDNVRPRFCRSDGDYCIAARRRKGRIYLSIKTTVYRGTYLLCVVAPDGFKDCDRFSFGRARRGARADTVNWAQNFPNRGRGRYRVYWKPETAQLRPTLTFRRH